MGKLELSFSIQQPRRTTSRVLRKSKTYACGCAICRDKKQDSRAGTFLIKESNCELQFAATSVSMATLNSTSSNCIKLRSFIRPTIREPAQRLISPSYGRSPSAKSRRNWVVGSITEERKDASVGKTNLKDGGKPLPVKGSDDLEKPNIAGDAVSSEVEKLVSRGANAAIVLGMGTLAVTKLLTIDHDYWHGWTLFEILRYVPEHNWIAYEEALKTNPVLAKMVISGMVYAIGDWIAQCYEGKPLFEFDRARIVRSGLVGFTLHGSLSHYYYQFCEALIPFQDWWVVPAKVAFDQTVWAAVWNSVYFVVLGFLRFESPSSIFGELKATFWPMLTAGWKLWPFAHLITYGVIPVEQRLLWVDCVELIWVTILSTYSNEKANERISDGSETGPDSP